MKTKFFLFCFYFVIQNLNAQWVQLNIPSIDYSSIVAAPSGTGGTNLFAATAGMGILLSTDLGVNWTPINGANGELNYAVINALGVAPNGNGGATVLAGNGDLGVFRSTNNGVNWTFCGIGNHEVISFATSPDGSQLFAGTRDDGIYYSTDNGINWTKIGLSDKQVTAITVTPDGSGRINVYAGTWFQGLYHLTNNNGLWTSNNLGFTNDWIMTLANTQNGTSVFAGTHNSGLYVSTNNGLNWIQTTLSAYDIRSLIFLETNYFAGTSDGIFVSTDSGSSWNSANQGLGCLIVTSLDTAGTFVFATTAGEFNCTPSVYRRPISEMITPVGIQINQSSPEFSLKQNYPNPFNSTTSLKYTLHQPSNVRLAVYNLVGELVSLLVNEYQSVGEHSTTFEGNNLPSGVYYYRINIADKFETGKMMLIK